MLASPATHAVSRVLKAGDTVYPEQFVSITVSYRTLRSTTTVSIDSQTLFGARLQFVSWGTGVGMEAALERARNGSAGAGTDAAVDVYNRHRRRHSG